MTSELRVDKIHNEGGDNDSGLDMSTNDVVAVKIAGSEKVRIHSDGNVGIGTTSPAADLTIKTASNEEDAILIEQSDGTDVGSLRINGGAFILKGKSATAPIQIQTVDGNEDIEVDPDGFIKFETAGSERMRINSDGRVDYRTNAAAGVYGVSITATDSQSDIGVAGSGTSTQHRIKFFNTNGQVGAINTSGSATSYNTSSDYRLKENVTTSWDATSRLKQLKPSRFNFKTDKDTIVDGFLAHEVSSVVPEAITGTKDEVDKDGNPIMQSIDQSKLVPLLVKAIQELSAKNDTLEAQVADLITRVKALEDK